MLRIFNPYLLGAAAILFLAASRFLNAPPAPSCCNMYFLSYFEASQYLLLPAAQILSHLLWGFSLFYAHSCSNIFSATLRLPNTCCTKLLQYFLSCFEAPHCKKSLRFYRPQPGCHLPNSPWTGIIKLFLSRESLVSDIPLKTGKWQTFFYSAQYSLLPAAPILSPLLWGSSILFSPSCSNTLFISLFQQFIDEISNILSFPSPQFIFYTYAIKQKMQQNMYKNAKTDIDEHIQLYF